MATDGARVLIGTSGFSYPEWKPAFYPAGLPQREFLRFYAGVFVSCEINATFYRLQAEKTLTGWVGAVPDDFRFVVKAHRGLTHVRALPTSEHIGTGGLLDRFHESLDPLAGRLGAILVQLPPTKSRDDEGLAGLLGAVGGRVAPIALELRHESWLDPSLDARLAEAGGTRCYADWTGEPPAALPPGPIAYVRLRADRYTSDQRSGWASLLRAEGALRPVFAFAKHEGTPPDDPLSGIGLARWLAAELSP